MVEWPVAFTVYLAKLHIMYNYSGGSIEKSIYNHIVSASVDDVRIFQH
jgi:hypothetical protein